MLNALASLVNGVYLALVRAGTRPGRAQRLGAVLLGFSLLAGPLVTHAAQAAQTNPITLAARAGYDGYYKDQRWMPIRITVANDGPDAKGTLRVMAPRYNSAELLITRAVELPTQSRREIYLYIPTESYLSSLKISLFSDDNKEIANQVVRLTQTNATDLLYGVVAGSPAAYNSVLAQVDPLNGQSYVAQLELEDLPPVTYAWHALDVLVFSDVDTGALTPDQRAALAGWVSAGGRLIVAGGPTWQKTAAGLADLLPLTPAGTTTLAALPTLASFSSADTAPLGPAVAAIGSLAPDAITLVAEGDVPLVVVRHSGFGQVAFLAVDPAFDPLVGWEGSEGLYRNMLTGTAQRPSWSAGMRNWYSARDAINALPGLDFPSAFQICGFLGFYLIMVGPVNYLVLKRLKRRELAWITIPALVVVFSAGAYLAGYQLRGGSASLHRLSVVQVWPDSPYARVEGVVGLFSPRRAQYDLSFGAGFLARPMPVDAYSGTASSYTVEQSDQTYIRDIRLEVGAVEPFVVQGQVPAPSFSSNLVLNVSSTTPVLRGTVTNNSDLTLTDAVILGPGGVQRLDELGPGETATISLALVDNRASVASANDILPALGTRALAVSIYYPPNNYDTTIDDILGNTYYYNDREQFRRYSLLSSLIDTYGGSVRGNGVYLAGWTTESPLPIEVVDRKFDTLDSSLYLVALTPQMEVSSGKVVIPPGLMQWMSLNTTPSSTPTPYDMYLYQGNVYELRFVPTQAPPFQTVDSLEMHLTSYGLAGAAGVTVEMWDFTENVWVAVASPRWGNTKLPQPARFVGPSGEIQTRVSNSGAIQVSVERLDFTLTGLQ